MTRRRFEDASAGDEIPAQWFPVDRSTLVRYAGASGDFNVIHWSERLATSVGLPNVIAHGMFTMAEVGRVATAWVGDPTAVLEFGVRFTRPVVVPDDGGGVVIVVSGTVESLDPVRRVAVLNLVAKVGEEKVLMGSRVTVALA